MLFNVRFYGCDILELKVGNVGSTIEEERLAVAAVLRLGQYGKQTRLSMCLAETPASIVK